MHLKRQGSPKVWPVERKGKAYLARPSSSGNFGIPIIIVLRDMLKAAQNRKEVKELVSSKKIFINHKAVNDEKRDLLFFDVLSMPSMGKFYRLVLSERGKFSLEEIGENEAGRKISKIINKKVLKGKKVQLNLMDGRNFLSGMKCSVNDSVIIDLKKNTLEKCLPLKEASTAFVFEGKHLGKSGKITKISGNGKMAEVDGKGGKINVLIKQVMVIE